jgi:hypothetical protein
MHPQLMAVRIDLQQDGLREVLYLTPTQPGRAYMANQADVRKHGLIECVVGRVVVAGHIVFTIRIDSTQRRAILYRESSTSRTGYATRACTANTRRSDTTTVRAERPVVLVSTLRPYAGRFC